VVFHELVLSQTKNRADYQANKNKLKKKKKKKKKRTKERTRNQLIQNKMI